MGGKSKDVDTFVDQLKSEGEKISNVTPNASSAAAAAAARYTQPDIPTDELSRKINIILFFLLITTFFLESIYVWKIK